MVIHINPNVFYYIVYFVGIIAVIVGLLFHIYNAAKEEE